MKKQLNKILILTLFVLFFTLSKSYAIEDVTEFTEAINEAMDKFNNISEASTEESKIIDEAIKEIDKATKYVQDAINNDNAEDAIKTLEFIEKSLSDVSSIIPQEFSSDMSNMDISAIPKEDMDIINELTKQMNVAKEKKENEFMIDLLDLNQKGIDTASISEKLNDLGVDTIKLVFDIDESKSIENWTKDDWAESYKGSILTSAGSEVITDEEINTKVVSLEEKLQANSAAILDKRASLTELQTKIDPLSNEITDLQTQKTNLLAKYNEEILKQSSTILSDKEISQSKDLAGQLNNQLSEITNEIKAAEEQSNSLQQQVQSLNLELNNEIASKTQLENNIRDLSNQLSANQNVLSQKTSELNRLKNTDLNLKINSLNEQIQYASRERDFIETDFERSIDLEVDALARYYSALGDVDSKDFDKQIDFSMREVGVIMDADPRKARAFEIEKYATYAGLSNEKIQEGINAVNNDDWDAQKNFYKEITKSLAKNPDWQVDIPSNAELNTMIEEEKAIQAAALASMDLDRINSEWNEKINEQLKEVGPEAGLNIGTLKYAATWEGMREHDFIKNEFDKLISESNLEQKVKDLNVAIKNYDNYMKNYGSSSGKLDEYDINIALDLQTKYWQASSAVSDLERNTASLARQNVIERAEKATAKYKEIISQVNPDRVAVEEKVASILKKVPTFEKDAENLAGLDPATLRARLVDITNGNNNESKALSAARDAVSKIGNAPIGNLTGPTWQMTNVKAAAIVRSKKYSYVDDYAYIQAEYGDPLSLNSAQREDLEGELKNVLSRDNVKLQALNAKVTELSNELNLTKEQSQNISTEMEKLENELSSLKISEDNLQSQISDLTNQFNSKESLISEKNQNLASLQEQLNPIGEQMTALRSQRAELDGKLNDQLNTIANKVKDQGQVTDEANELKVELESQIAQIDNQIKEFENQSNEINSQLTTITTEISVLESENPELANQIASLNQDLKYFKDIKAELAMATAKTIGLKINEKTVQSINKFDGKALISIEGTDLVRIVDQKNLIDEAEKFIDPISSFSLNTKVYKTDAVKPELFIAEEITNAYSTAKEVRVVAREKLAALEATEGASKEEIQAAQAAVAEAKYAEIAAGQSLVTNKEMITKVESAQETLDKLIAIRSTPGMDKWNVRRTEAAIKAAEAQIAGTNYDYEGALNKIANDEQKFNVWRVEDYKKEIELAKKSGNAADLKAYTRRLNNFQQRLIDQQSAFQSINEKQTNYIENLSKATIKAAALSGSSVEESVNAVAEGTKQASELQIAASSSVKGNNITTAYDTAKAAREQIDKELASLRQASGGVTTEAIKAAEAARSAALQTEISAANVVAANSTAIQAAAQTAAAAAQDAAQEVAQEATQVAQAAQEAAKSAAEATLETLRQAASTPGMSQWEVHRALAAVKAAEAEIAGTEYDLDHALATIEKNKAYEEAGGEPNRSGRTWDGH